MQNYNTIIGVITMRQNECSYPVIERRYHIGSNTAQLIIKKFNDLGLSLDEIKQMNPSSVEDMFYPQSNLKRKDIPMPDFQYWYDRIHAKGSKVNLAYCWIEYRKQNPEGYGQSQFYEYYKRFVDSHFPGEKSVVQGDCPPVPKGLFHKNRPNSFIRYKNAS